MTAFLVDTNVLSELVRPAPAHSVVSFLQSTADLWLSVVTLHELSYGIARTADARRRLKLEQFSLSMKNQFGARILAIDASTAELAGELRAFAATQGRVLQPLDSLIAACAASRSFTLATRNVKDFDYLDLNLFNPWGA